MVQVRLVRHRDVSESLGHLNGAGVLRLVKVVRVEIPDEWLVADHRCLSEATMPLPDDDLLVAVAG